MYQSGRAGDEAKKRKSPAKSGRIGITVFGINTTSDISKLLYVISRAVWRAKFETIHEWYLCQISRTNHVIICLYLQKVCNFHM